LQKFQGQYYHLYHNGALMESWKKDNVIGSDCGIFRSLCVNKATVDEATQNIHEVKTDLEGVTAIKNMNPYEWQQAETMASCGGVDYEDFTNIKKNTKINTLGNDASENMQVKMKESSWINVRKVDFGTAGAATFTLRGKGTATIELRTSRAGRPIATIEFASDEMGDQTFDIDASKFQGVKTNLFIAVKAATDFYVDAWQFTEVGAASIQDVKSDTKSARQYFDLTGRRLTDGQQHSGIVIEQYTDENGVKHTRKVVSDNAQ
jgi:arabinoxylan arabinofuranohydrolase